MVKSLIFFSVFAALNALAQPNDPYLAKEQWWVKSAEETGGASIQAAWSITRNKYMPKVAIIDSGIDTDHPEFQNQILVNSKEIPGNNIDDDNNGCVDDVLGCDAMSMRGNISDSGNHGTHVAGLIGARHNNKIGIAGAARFVKIIPIKLQFGNMPAEEMDGQFARAIDYAINRGADIINMSLVIPVDRPQFRAAIQRAQKKKILIVAAAGNDNVEVNQYPALYANKFSNILVVAASTPQRIRASFSNYSPLFAHVFAPGAQILAPVPGAIYQYKSGTSMATPIVSGIAANILATYGKLPPEALKERIIETSHRFENFEGAVSSKGLVNAYNAITGQMSINFSWKK